MSRPSRSTTHSQLRATARWTQLSPLRPVRRPEAHGQRSPGRRGLGGSCGVRDRPRDTAARGGRDRRDRWPCASTCSPGQGTDRAGYAEARVARRRTSSDTGEDSRAVLYDFTDADAERHECRVRVSGETVVEGVVAGHVRHGTAAAAGPDGAAVTAVAPVARRVAGSLDYPRTAASAASTDPSLRICGRICGGRPGANKT